jgi:hypothetical protein
VRKGPQDAFPTKKEGHQATQKEAANETDGYGEKKVWPLAIFHNACGRPTPDAKTHSRRTTAAPFESESSLRRSMKSGGSFSGCFPGKPKARQKVAGG